jgi:hypothetical protein
MALLTELGFHVGHLLQTFRSYLCAIWHKDIFKLYLFIDVLFYNVCNSCLPVEMLEGRA